MLILFYWYGLVSNNFGHDHFLNVWYLTYVRVVLYQKVL